MARIWRASFQITRPIEVVIVDADALQQGQTSGFAVLAQNLLQMKNVSDCEKDWPFETQMGLEQFLQQLEDLGAGWDGSFATYLSWQQHGGQLHALGLGSNKKRRKQAGLLALMLARLLISQRDLPGELREDFHRAVITPVRWLQLCPGTSPVGWERGQQPEEPWKRTDDKPWLPVPGSWMWWHGQSLVVLCEDQQARIFAEAKTWFYEAAEVNEEPWPEDLKDPLREDVEHVFPDIFFTSRFVHGRYSAIAVGRDVKHRVRAGCLGLAAQIWNDRRSHLTPAQQLVLDEIRRSTWLPEQPLQRFYCMESQGFWQNMEMWAEGQRDQAFGKVTVNEIRMNCQPALLKELETNSWAWAEIDLTNSNRPWRGIIEGHQEAFRFKGQKIERFAIEADRNKRDKYQECPLIYFAVRMADGTVHTFDSLDRTATWMLQDETMSKKRERKDEILAPGVFLRRFRGDFATGFERTARPVTLWRRSGANVAI
eukprot:Skav236254  [mRNA]  locus=scaffold829:402360:406823:- [translate_table: standard]